MDPNMLIEALKDVKSPFSILFIATLTGAIVRVLKTKSLNEWLDGEGTPKWMKAIPKRALPYLAIVFAGGLTFLDAWLNAKADPMQALSLALFGAVLSGGTAVGGHETIAKFLAALSSVKPPPAATGDDAPKTPRSPDGNAGPYRTAIKIDPPVITVDVPAGASMEETRKKVLESMHAAGWTGIVFKSIAVAAVAVLMAACGFLTPKTVTDLVLKAADIACLETGKGAAFDVPEEAAKACEIATDPIIQDIIKNLVGQRVAAKRAGFVWTAGGGHIETARDGGACAHQDAALCDGGAR